MDLCKQTLRGLIIIGALILCFLFLFNDKFMSMGGSFSGGGRRKKKVEGGASTSNALLLKKNGSDYDVMLGKLKEHGSRLQFPAGFHKDDEDMEMTALRGASEMIGKDLVKEYYGKGKAATHIYKETEDGTKRATVTLIMSKDVSKLDDYEQNNELDTEFSNDPTRTIWVSLNDLKNEDTVKSDKDEDIDIPFYIKKTAENALKRLSKE